MLKCCYFRCNRAADVIITDSNELRPDIADTYSCLAHAGHLIGSVGPTKPTGPWIITSIIKKGVEEKSTTTD